ncbi:MAG: phage tail fiber protein, partial [Chloroflexota bacterium]|nr:phage tail fiber protein [Chloroflexota bacterium]
MANTYARYPADGTTAVFTVPCPYIEQAHIKVRVNGFLCIQGAHYDFLSSSQIRFRSGFLPVNLATVEIRRETVSNVPLVTFQNGAILNETDLNTATLQTLFISQETRDFYEAALVSGFNRLVNGTAVTAQDAIDAAVQEVLQSSLLADLQSRISDIDANAESILSNSVAINTMQTVIDSLLSIEGVGIATFVLNEQQERIAGDTALAQALGLIGAVNGDSTAFVLDLDKVQVDGSTSLGSRLSGIDTAVGDNSAAIAAEASARSSADSAIASDVSTLAAQVTSEVGTLTAAIESEATARADADDALASAITTLAATVGDNTAAISSEASARASGDSAIASTVSTLSSTVGDHTAALSTIGTAIDGIAAQYMVKTDVNGRVAGFGLYNDGATAEFVVLADKFAIVDPSDSSETPVVPFVVTDGVVHMQDVVIGNALIASLNVGKLVSGTLNADIEMGTGKIIWAQGGFMRVSGAGFGSSNQFLEWFGPYNADLSTCT